jgi:hypothetical protein
MPDVVALFLWILEVVFGTVTVAEWRNERRSRREQAAGKAPRVGPERDG